MVNLAPCAADWSWDYFGLVSDHAGCAQKIVVARFFIKEYQCATRTLLVEYGEGYRGPWHRAHPPQSAMRGETITRDGNPGPGLGIVGAE